MNRRMSQQVMNEWEHESAGHEWVATWVGRSKESTGTLVNRRQELLYMERETDPRMRLVITWHRTNHSVLYWTRQFEVILDCEWLFSFWIAVKIYDSYQIIASQFSQSFVALPWQQILVFAFPQASKLPFIILCRCPPTFLEVMGFRESWTHLQVQG